MDAGDDAKATTARVALKGSGAKLLNVYIYDNVLIMCVIQYVCVI